ncbi:MAG: chromosome partitioning protein [Cyclobacteriaceae bacterium]
MTNVASHNSKTPTFYDHIKSLMHDRTPQITPLEITPYLHLIPGDYKMAELESNNHYINFGTEINYRFFSHLSKEYDLILLDCPTHFGVFVKSLFYSINSILIPTVPDYFSVTGVQTLLHHLASFSSSQSINILAFF